MKHRVKASRARRAIAAALAATCLSLLGVAAGTIGSSAAPADTAAPAFSQTKTVTRDHLVNGADDVVASKTVTVTADVTTNLRQSQAVNIAWSGAQPTGGVVYDNNAQYAAQQEYPMAILQCRGVDSEAVPASQRVSPETCYTQTPEQRYQPPSAGAFPAYRLDRYATQAERGLTVGAPSPIPAGCPQPDGVDAERWVPFLAADGTVYAGGPQPQEPNQACGNLAPEQAFSDLALNEPNTTWATTGLNGTGSAKFLVDTAQFIPSLGCSATVACAIVVVPIMGISCDASGSLALPVDRPTDPVGAYKQCSQTGYFNPGAEGADSTGQGPDTNTELSVSGELWWSASNWRNRISIPITIAQTASVCSFVSSTSSVIIDGAESLQQATQQWAPSLCQGASPYQVNHVVLSSPVAKTALASGSIEAAFQEQPPDPGEFDGSPVVQAPTAVSGFAIAYVMDDSKGHAYTSLKLDARLLAKLMTMSYPAYVDVKAHDPGLRGNPLNMGHDPEFLALNPGMAGFPSYQTNQVAASATIELMSSDSDVMTALTSYITSDPEARAWLNGAPDPWGMTVNAKYLNLSLPVSVWPLNDSYVSPVEPDPVNCPGSPILPLVASPVSDSVTIANLLQLGISNSQLNCVQEGASTRYKLAALGRQNTGSRFLIGLVSLGDARRYGLSTAALQTQRSLGAPVTFANTEGRSFSAPTDASLQAAADLMVPDAIVGTWRLPSSTLNSDPAGANAYPGTFLISTDIPTSGLATSDAALYSRFLRFVAGPAQTPGLGNGQLPPGYLAITPATGLSTMAAYTATAAADVGSQNGVVPLLNGLNPVDVASPPGPTASSAVAAPSNRVTLPAPVTSRVIHTSSSHSTTASSSHPSANTAAALSPQPANSSAPLPVPPAAYPSKPSPVSSPTPAPKVVAASATPTISAPVQLLGETKNQPSGPLGWVLPVLLLLAAVSGLGSAWISGVGRRP